MDVEASNCRYNDRFLLEASLVDKYKLSIPGVDLSSSHVTL